ncbi:hypothetical protein GA0115244_1172111, partial [Streptomyces sp. DvalAA-19]
LPLRRGAELVTESSGFAAFSSLGVVKRLALLVRNS